MIFPSVDRRIELLSAAGAAIFATTLSSVVTTPGALATTRPFSGFLLKGLLLLGAELFTSAESFRAVRVKCP
ncbi:MAG TPA: hypothetical protein VLV78_05930 [Thermoanaerobaculia bacterium]|nr:hypothetical protein [Thermoanaerobaculia bacterium]